MDFSTENDTLSRISKALYGDALTLAVMDPKDISLLKKNARILKKDVFQQLTANIGRDKRLSSVPLVPPPERRQGGSPLREPPRTSLRRGGDRAYPRHDH